MILPSGSMSIPAPELCFMRIRLRPSVSSISVTWPDTVSLTWFFVYSDAGKSSISKSSCSCPPPSNNLFSSIPLAALLVTWLPLYSLRGNVPLGLKKPSCCIPCVVALCPNLNSNSSSLGMGIKSILLPLPEY